MKTIVLFLLFCLFSYSSIAQDLVYTSKTDSIDCMIDEFRNDTLFIKVKVDNRKRNTHILSSTIWDYKFGIVKKLEIGKSYKLILADESVFVAKVDHIGKDSLQASTNYISNISIYLGAIVDVIPQKISEKYARDHWMENPHHTRYFFAPTAFNIKQGEGYYQNAYVLLNSVNYGVTDHFSIGGGIEFISTFSGNPSLFITPKLGYFIHEKFAVSLGAIAGIVGGEEAAGIGYLNGTYGSYENNITLGLGWGFISDEFYNEPIINVNGMMRISKRFSLVSENWIIPQYRYEYNPPNYEQFKTDTYYMPFFSYGFRYFKDKISIDFAFVNSTDIAEFIFIGIPYIDFVLLF